MSQLCQKYVVFMSLACRFYVISMSLMSIFEEMLSPDIQSFMALTMSNVIKYGFSVSKLSWINFSCLRKQIN